MVGIATLGVAIALGLTACGSGDHPPPLTDFVPPALDAGSHAPPAPAARPSAEGKLRVTNSGGRTGSYFLPRGFNLEPRPLLLAYHGSGGSGDDMVAAFRSLAVARGIIVVAPDSQSAGVWIVGDREGDVTEDYLHALACLDEVLAMPDVLVDDGRTLAAGYSGGGSSAPYLASNESPWAAFAVLHGGVIQGGIGPRILRGWFSTGEADPARPPALVQESVDYIRGLGFSDVTFELYPGGHGLSEAELNDVVVWWLGE